MPAAYAHYRFGRDLLAHLPQEKQDLIQDHRTLYDLGLQGPDLLFYCHPLRNDPLNGQGARIHAAPAERFFRPAAELLGSSGEKEGLTAYLWGFLCHFALDWHCHAYIESAVQPGGPGHLAMETDFDRALLAEEGLPITAKYAGSQVRPSRQDAGLICGLFPGMSAGQLCRAMAAMRINQWFLNSQNPLIRGLVKLVLKLFGRYEKLGPMLLHSRPDPLCQESTRQLMCCYTQAQDTALDLIRNFRPGLWEEQERENLYRYNFNAKKENANET